MDEQGVKESLILLGTLWQNYKPPQETKEIEATHNAWLGFFRNVPTPEVHKAIMKLASDGREFAPNVGQIYAEIKDQRVKALPAPIENAATKLRDYRKPIDEAYRSKGLYPYHEAREHGISSGEWERMVKA
jgi:hypothetical protein